MTVRVVFRKQTFVVKPGMTLRNALEDIGVDPETVIAIREGEMITADETLRDEDDVKLISIISGGGF